MLQAWKKLHQQLKPIGFRQLVFKTFLDPHGVTHELTTYGRPGTRDVAVIALTPKHKVVVARQFRHGPEEIMDELPGGLVDEGESLEAATARELLEETGYKPTKLEPIGYTIRDAYTNGVSHYFIGYDCQKITSQQLDHGEFIEVATISIAQLLKNARSGKMTDAAAVLLAYDKLKDIQLQEADNED